MPNSLGGTPERLLLPGSHSSSNISNTRENHTNQQQNDLWRIDNKQPKKKGQLEDHSQTKIDGTDDLLCESSTCTTYLVPKMRDR